jgi:hypothetical protein
LWLALLGAGLVLIGCAGPATETAAPPQSSPTAGLAQVADRLDEMEARWQAQGLVEYEFQFRWQCFCTPGYRQLVQVTVVAGEIESVMAVDATPGVTLPDRDEYRTVDGLYDLLRDAVERNPYSIQVEYDETLGYPTSAYIDYEQNVADEELGFEISDLKVRP